MLFRSSELINTNLQVTGEADTDVGATTTDAGPDSSDTESDDADDRKTARDSSETESGSEPEDTSRETPSPRPGTSSAQARQQPKAPEQLEPKQLKKLETMKESPA